MTTVEDIQFVRKQLTQEGLDPEQYFPSCVGCGYCCKQAICSLGIWAFKIEDPYVQQDCPALYWDGKRYLCKLAEQCRDQLYIGVGCCSPANDWRKEVRKR